jgi:predicted outer membrane protein
MLRKEILEKKQEALKKKDYGFDNGYVEKIVLAHQFVLN